MNETKTSIQKLPKEIIYIIILLIGLVIALLLVRQRQEIRKKAYETVCTITFKAPQANDQWRTVTPSAGGTKYQILSSANNSFQIEWSCPATHPVSSFRVLDGENDITAACRSGDSTAFCNIGTGCLPDENNKTVTCVDLPAREYQVSLRFN